MEQIQALLANSSLVPFALAMSLMGLLAYAVYRVRSAPERAESKVAGLLQELNTVTTTLNEAEKIGHFGSFTWDFETPEASYWSEEMYEIFGLTKRRKPPEIDIFIELASKEDKENILNTWKGIQMKSGHFSFMYRVVAPDGASRYVRVQGSTLMGFNQQLRRAHGVVHDITKEMEIDKSKTEFVSLASHQLKTPLTSIRWLVEALMSGSLGEMNPQQKKYAENIQQTVQRMIDMVNDLLTVSRIELNKLARQIEEIDVQAFAQNVIDEQRHDAESKQIKFNFTCEPNLPHISADKISLRHVFQNLISNAIKYTPIQGTVTCKLSLSGAKQESLFLEVSDTGIGIPKAEHDRVFEKLHRAKNAQALVPDGTGLGLYVVKTVIDKAGGGISFESVEGKGTTFYVTIPVRWKALDAPAPSSH
ncbi:MAG: hypothetical protein RIQ56_268 [Candidatus Parcubacteria bacterium]